ncbi:unnamed protein product [Symbiodinium sp. CCMP2592]|nr:unnamed protein product [Symbiodinium sp. CCMP2592]
MGPEWSQRHSTWFADDALFQALVHSENELQQQLKAISKALWVLQKLGLSIASTKCAVLLHLGGTAAQRVRAKLVSTHNKKPHITFQHEDHVWRLPLVSKHDYLGATLSYSRMEDLTATRRIQAAQTSFDRLKPVLTHKGLPLFMRLQIWQACVVSSLLYSLPQVGLTPSAAQRVSVIFYRNIVYATRSTVPDWLSSDSKLLLIGPPTCPSRHPVNSRVHNAGLQPSHYLSWKEVDRFENGTEGCQQTLILQLAQATRPKPKLVTILSRCLRQADTHRLASSSAALPVPLSALPDTGITEPTAPPRQPAAREPQVLRTL